MSNLEELITSAENDDKISSQTASQLLQGNTLEQIEKGMGISANDFSGSEAMLITLLIDDSRSIEWAQNTRNIIDGHNIVLEALRKSKQAESMLVCCRYLNGTVLYPYTYLAEVPEMTVKNYNPDGGTPLYDQTMVVLGQVSAKAQEFEDAGIMCRTWTMILN